MIIDGVLLARQIKSSLKSRIVHFEHPLRLGVFVLHETPEIRQFVDAKRRFGASLGITVEVLTLGVLEQNNQELLHRILQATRDYDGLVLQLPLPRQFQLESVLNLFPLSHDVDVIGTTAFQQHKEGALPFLPPVVGAIAEILAQQQLSLAGRQVLIVGEGLLVGEPAKYWAEHLGALVTVATRATADLATLTARADVLILGAGSPHLITPDMVKQGVLIFDAGTSESEGVVQGDADPACATKAMIFTPTPGGIGPITVAKLFENLITLQELKLRQRAHH
jgi:methylenetetrahydrofolate dehydrogenase (NADP+) / methenyltetrahydrofolate cyclohydrolase